jgi:2-oxo-3-hexenedioate decarboxylase
MNSQEILKLATILDTATLEAREIERLTLRYPDLDLTTGYRIQDAGISFRVSRGERPIGFKMGFTSQAKREQMNLGSPIYGILTDRMEVPSDSTLSLEGMIHPKIEPEIAFFISREIRGTVTTEEALVACSGVCAALEILDSRFLNFKYFSLPDVIADNCSSSRFILSKISREVRKVDLANLDMSMSVNGKVVQRALSSAISQNPINSIIQLSEILASRNLGIPAGSIVLAGAATQAVPLESDSRVQLSVEGLGQVGISVSSSK